MVVSVLVQSSIQCIICDDMIHHCLKPYNCMEPCETRLVTRLHVSITANYVICLGYQYSNIPKVKRALNHNSINFCQFLNNSYCCHSKSAWNGYIVSHIWSWSIVLMIVRLRGLKIQFKMCIFSPIMFDSDQYWIIPRSIKLHNECISFWVGKHFEEDLPLKMREWQRMHCLHGVLLAPTGVNVLQKHLIETKVWFSCNFLVFNL